MKKRLTLDRFEDKIFVDVFIELPEIGWTLLRQHILMRSDLAPATREVYPSDYFSVYIKGLSNFFIDQAEIKEDSLVVSSVLGVNTLSMTNAQLIVELKKL